MPINKTMTKLVPDVCTACARASSVIVGGAGNYSAKFMYIALEPSYDDYIFSRPFTGDRSIVFNRLLTKAGISSDDIYVSYLVKCYKKTKPRIKEIRECAKYIHKEIEFIKPKIIFLEGPNVLKYFANDRKMNLKVKQGAYLSFPEYPDITFIPLYSLDSIFADFKYEAHIVNIIKKAINKKIEEDNPIIKNYIYIESEDQLDKLFVYLRNYDKLSLDIETTGANTFIDTKTVCWAIAWKPGNGAYFPWLTDSNDFYWDDSVRERIIHKWNNFLKNKKLILHNGKYDLKILKHDIGLTSLNYWFDTVISSNIIDETQASLKLKNLVWRWTSMGGYDDPLDAIKLKLKVKKNYSKIPRKILKEYVIGDADASFRLFDKQYPLIKKNKLEFLMFDIYMPISNIFLELEYRGVLVDTKYIIKLRKQYIDKLAKLKKDIIKYAGFDLDVNSSKQLSELLYTKLKLPSLKNTKTQKSTDKQALTLIKGKHPIIDLLLTYKSLSTLLHTFVDSIINFVDDKGYIHTEYSVGTQSTSRISSSKPNLQNLPRENKDIKKAFIAHKGYTYYEFDFSQIEIRVLAHLSKDTKLVAALRSGGDIHKMMAADVYGIPLDKVTKELRSNAKSVSFGIIYGMGYKSLITNKGMSEASAKSLYNNFFKTYSGVTEWINSVKQYAKIYKKVYTPFNRVRHLDAIDHPLTSISSKCERCAVNSPIQSMGADIPNLAFITLLKIYDPIKYDYKFCFQIHDAVVLEVNKKKSKELIPKFKKILETAFPLIVATPVGIKFGPSLGEMQDYVI